MDQFWINLSKGLFQSSLKSLKLLHLQPGVLVLLNKLVQSESHYHSFNYKTRYFTKNEGYLDPVLWHNISSLNETTSFNEQERIMLKAVKRLISLRKSLIKFYCQFGEMSNSKVDFELLLNLLPENEPILERIQQFGKVANCELNVLNYLIKAELGTVNYDLKQSCLCIVKAKQHLKILMKSELTNWLTSLLESVHLKISLYFYNTLLLNTQQSTVNQSSINQQSPVNHSSIDQHSSLHQIKWKCISDFIHNHHCQSVCLIYMLEKSIYYEQGYQCSQKNDYQPPIGLSSYPAVASFPSEPPLDHWPNIISIIQNYDRKQSWLDKTTKTIADSQTSIESEDLPSSKLYNSLLTWRRKDFTSNQSIQSIEEEVYLPWWKRKNLQVYFYDVKVNTSYALSGVDGRLLLVSIHPGDVFGDVFGVFKMQFVELCRELRYHCHHRQVIRKLIQNK